jgi:uncharacterized protein involved in outer membrane biogenesis
MSQLLSPTIPHAEPLDQAPAKRHSWTRWPKWIFLLLALLWVADAGMSFLIQHTRLRAKLTHRLEVSFGRPVEVGSYQFSLWDGPALEAQSVTVAEDPRFGHEYFLHTDSLTVRLLWSSLLRGRIGLGTLSLTDPSLNLVRDTGGNWNISEWLPPPAGSGAQSTPAGIGPRLPGSALSFRRIEITGGRINFKRADEKLPYALADVSGAVEVASQSRWHIDLEAVPWRAAGIFQQAGILHLAGDVGGTSSRLLPAALQLSWTEASLPDVLRLARGDDSGLRGTLAASAIATTQGEDWSFQVRTELRQLHRWDLTVRSDSPAVNVIAKIHWNPRASALELTDATIEAPHSNAHVSGKFDWSSPQSRVRASPAGTEATQFQVLSSAIDLQDALAWARAFRSGISDEIVLHGSASVQMSVAGWPLHIDEAGVTADNAELSAANLRVPAHLGSVEVHYAKNALSFSAPATVSFGDDTSALRVDGAAAWGAVNKRTPQAPTSHFRVAGNVTQVRDLVATAGLLGWNLSRGWDVTGPIRCDLLWQGSPSISQSRPTGFIEWGALDAAAADGPAPRERPASRAATNDEAVPSSSLRAPFLNQPVAQIVARVDFKPGATHLTLASAQAFGARWTGTLDRPAPSGEWQFALSADHLAAADFDRWLNPRAQDNFLDRMLPFLNGRSQAAAVPEGLRAAGHISVDQFTLAPFVLRSLQGNLTLGGRHVTLEHASAKLYGGTVAGTFNADLQAAPVYRVDTDFSRANLSSLLADLPGLAALSADSVSGAASFETHGASRSDLLAALTCEGKASVSDFGLSNIDLLGSMRLGNTQPGESAFQDASAAFTCVNGQIHFENLLLEGHNILLGGSGTVDFNRNLDLQLHIVSDDAVGPRQSKSSAAALGQIYQLSSTLASPQVTPFQSAAPRRVR